MTKDTLSKRICVIGAGPSGLAALKCISDSQEFQAGNWLLVASETRDRVGGIWYPSEPIHDPPLTPLYDSLTTNIPHPVMAYSSYPFPPSTSIFPPASTVQTYLESYTAHFRLTSYIQFNTTVQNVVWNPTCSNWEVSIRVMKFTGDEEEKMTFDHVIIANGHFRKPRYPSTPGLSNWLQEGKAIHAAWYRRPSDLGLGLGLVEKVLVVGNGPSGWDISMEMCQCANVKTVVHSVSDTTTPGPRTPEQIGSTNLKTRKRGRVVSFGCGGEVTFEDGSVEEDVDICILATGYEMAFPFLPPSVLAQCEPHSIPSTPTPSVLSNSSYHVFPLAKHIFPIQSQYPPTSLAFMGLLLRGTPFSLFEAQAQAIVKVFTDPSSIDLKREEAENISRYQQLKLSLKSSHPDSESGLTVAIAKNWHKPTEVESFMYRNALYKYAGIDTRVEKWEENMWKYKVELRKEWEGLVRDGMADEWVREIGRGGKDDWVECLRRLLGRAGIVDV